MTQPTNQRLALILGAGAQVTDLLVRYRTATREAGHRVNTDARLTTEGKADALRTALTGVRQTFGTELTDLQDRVATALTQLQRTAANLLPHPAPGVEGILNRQSWWARSRTLFAAGARSQDVIGAATSPEHLHSLKEELPTAVAAGLVPGYGHPDILNNLIDRRLAELMSPAALTAHDTAREAEVAVAGLMPSLQYAQAEVTGQAQEGGGLTASIAGVLARQQATLRLRPIEQDMTAGDSAA